MVARSIVLVSALALAAPVVLEARDQWGSYGNQAYSEGYQRGVRSGDEDSRRGDPYNYTDESDFRRADAGYRREYGNVDRYRDEFRRGFEQGYRIGYDRNVNDRRNGPPPWANGRANGRGNGRGNSPFERYGDYRNNQYDLAFQNGYNDGYERGLDDGRDRRRNDPFGESRYRDADHLPIQHHRREQAHLGLDRVRRQPIKLRRDGRIDELTHDGPPWLQLERHANCKMCRESTVS